jgi:spermidine synthase
MDDGFYFFERYTHNCSRHIKADKIFYEGDTKYQHVQIFSNPLLGKILFLDNNIQSAEFDEFIFHESLAHPALLSHPSPQNVLVIGGGEGATLREVLRHEVVKKAVMVDLDEELVSLCRKFLPEWSGGAFSDPRSELFFSDASRYVTECRQKFDVIISDLTEPINKGPSVYLFTKEFFEKIHGILKKKGMFVLQAGSADPYYHQFFSSLVRTLQLIFPVVRPYWAYVFSYGFPWGFVIASKKADPLEIDESCIKETIKTRSVEKLRYYHAGIHKGMFALPLYLLRGMRKGKILTKTNPFFWKL